MKDAIKYKRSIAGDLTKRINGNIQLLNETIKEDTSSKSLKAVVMLSISQELKLYDRLNHLIHDRHTSVKSIINAVETERVNNQSIISSSKSGNSIVNAASVKWADDVLKIFKEVVKDDASI